MFSSFKLFSHYWILLLITSAMNFMEAKLAWNAQSCSNNNNFSRWKILNFRVCFALRYNLLKYSYVLCICIQKLKSLKSFNYSEELYLCSIRYHSIYIAGCVRKILLSYFEIQFQSSKWVVFYDILIQYVVYIALFIIRWCGHC